MAIKLIKCLFSKKKKILVESKISIAFNINNIKVTKLGNS